MTRTIILLSSGFVLAGLTVLGCVPATVTPDATVPSARPVATDNRPYTYEHTVRTGEGDPGFAAPLPAKYIVAVGRVGDNKPVDTPFGSRDAIAIEAQADDLELKAHAGPAPGKQGMSEVVREQLISLLVDSKYFEVIERDEINEIVRELDFGESKYVSKDGRAPIGNLYGARYIISGGPDVNVNAFEDRACTPDNWVEHVGFPEKGRDDLPAVFRLRMYDVETGHIKAVGEGYALNHQEALRCAVTALERAVRRLERN